MSNKKDTGAAEYQAAYQAARCRVCDKGGMTRLEREHRVHEYCRSRLGSDWKLPQKATR